MMHSIYTEKVSPTLYTGEPIKTEIIQPSKDENELMTVSQVAEYYKVNQQTVYRWLKKGKLSAEKVGRMIRIKRKNLTQLLDRKDKTNNIKRGEPSRSARSASK